MKEGLNMDLSIIIPCHNEELNIPLLMDECEKVFAKEKINIEYVLVNDGSKDNTFREIKKLLDRNIKVVGINFSRNFGKEAAIYAGLTKCCGKYAAIMDADLQQHPKYVLEMYNYLMEHPEYDAVSCYQAKRKENKIVALLKKLFYKSINKMSSVELYEDASDFRIFNRKVIDSLLEMKEGYRFSKGLFSWVGYNTYYMPYEVELRKYGTSSWSLKSLFRYAIDGILGFSTSPLKLATNTGIIGIIVSIIYLLVVLIKGTFVGINIAIFLILLFGSMNLLAIGIIGEYLGRVYVETKNRPPFIIKDEVRN